MPLKSAIKRGGKKREAVAPNRRKTEGRSIPCQSLATLKKFAAIVFPEEKEKRGRERIAFEPERGN